MKDKPILEGDIRDYLLKVAKQYHALVRKVTWYQRKGAPDWFVAFNGVHLVELKRPGKDLEDHQHREIARLRLQGVDVRVLDSYEGIEDFFKEIKG
jgi:hypothetical protein